MTEWRPINAAPKDETRVDLWVVDPQYGPRRVTDAWWGEYDVIDKWLNRSPGGGPGWCMGGDIYGDFCIDNVEEDGVVVTHWMPLPSPPKESREG